ncbi:MAG: hypothetical protein OXG15_13105 [Gammaproteobacteria bacterium]|nr:hypothetical protein [Gammaproteobacteria bacterium]
MAVRSIDHVAIPIVNIDAMRSFYEAFGFDWDSSSAPHLYAVILGNQKLNFHAPSLWQNPKFALRGPTAKPGCGDFCFVWASDQHTLHKTIKQLDLEVIEGPVERLGGAGNGISVYVRDPDKNLVEFICYGTNS